MEPVTEHVGHLVRKKITVRRSGLTTFGKECLKSYDSAARLEGGLIGLLTLEVMYMYLSGTSKHRSGPPKCTQDMMQLF